MHNPTVPYVGAKVPLSELWPPLHPGKVSRDEARVRQQIATERELEALQPALAQYRLRRARERQRLRVALGACAAIAATATASCVLYLQRPSYQPPDTNPSPAAPPPLGHKLPAHQQLPSSYIPVQNAPAPPHATPDDPTWGWELTDAAALGDGPHTRLEQTQRVEVGKLMEGLQDDHMEGSSQLGQTTASNNGGESQRVGGSTCLSSTTCTTGRVEPGGPLGQAELGDLPEEAEGALDDAAELRDGAVRGGSVEKGDSHVANAGAGAGHLEVTDKDAALVGGGEGGNQHNVEDVAQARDRTEGAGWGNGVAGGEVREEPYALVDGEMGAGVGGHHGESEGVDSIDLGEQTEGIQNVEHLNQGTSGSPDRQQPRGSEVRDDGLDVTGYLGREEGCTAQPGVHEEETVVPGEAGSEVEVSPLPSMPTYAAHLESEETPAPGQPQGEELWGLDAGGPTRSELVPHGATEYGGEVSWQHVGLATHDHVEQEAGHSAGEACDDHVGEGAHEPAGEVGHEPVGEGVHDHVLGAPLKNVQEGVQGQLTATDDSPRTTSVAVGSNQVQDASSGACYPLVGQPQQGRNAEAASQLPHDWHVANLGSASHAAAGAGGVLGGAEGIAYGGLDKPVRCGYGDVICGEQVDGREYSHLEMEGYGSAVIDLTYRAQSLGLEATDTNGAVEGSVGLSEASQKVDHVAGEQVAEDWELAGDPSGGELLPTEAAHLHTGNQRQQNVTLQEGVAVSERDQSRSDEVPGNRDWGSQEASAATHEGVVPDSTGGSYSAQGSSAVQPQGDGDHAEEGEVRGAPRVPRNPTASRFCPTGGWGCQVLHACRRAIHSARPCLSPGRQGALAECATTIAKAPYAAACVLLLLGVALIWLAWGTTSEVTAALRRRALHSLGANASEQHPTCREEADLESTPAAGPQKLQVSYTGPGLVPDVSASNAAPAKVPHAPSTTRDDTFSPYQLPLGVSAVDSPRDDAPDTTPSSPATRLQQVDTGGKHVGMVNVPTSAGTASEDPFAGEQGLGSSPSGAGYTLAPGVVASTLSSGASPRVRQGKSCVEASLHAAGTYGDAPLRNGVVPGASAPLANGDAHPASWVTPVRRDDSQVTSSTSDDDETPHGETQATSPQWGALIGGPEAAAVPENHDEFDASDLAHFEVGATLYSPEPKAHDTETAATFPLERQPVQHAVDRPLAGSAAGRVGLEGRDLAGGGDGWVADTWGREGWLAASAGVAAAQWSLGELQQPPDWAELQDVPEQKHLLSISSGDEERAEQTYQQQSRVPQQAQLEEPVEEEEVHGLELQLQAGGSSSAAAPIHEIDFVGTHAEYPALTMYQLLKSQPTRIPRGPHAAPKAGHTPTPASFVPRATTPPAQHPLPTTHSHAYTQPSMPRYQLSYSVERYISEAEPATFAQPQPAQQAGRGYSSVPARGQLSRYSRKGMSPHRRFAVPPDVVRRPQQDAVACAPVQPWMHPWKLPVDASVPSCSRRDADESTEPPSYEQRSASHGAIGRPEGFTIEPKQLFGAPIARGTVDSPPELGTKPCERRLLASQGFTIEPKQLFGGPIPRRPEYSPREGRGKPCERRLLGSFSEEEHVGLGAVVASGS